jgi:L,D-peptidoglycan transpeptidase YkuD (ErfK/YbiS/YcfS/YnhG family)
MSHVLPMYRRGLLVDYPTDARRKAGSCIFIHVWRSPTTGTAGCVAVPEPRVEALQAFSRGGAVLAILPREALGRLKGCLP